MNLLQGYWASLTLAHLAAAFGASTSSGLLLTLSAGGAQTARVSSVIGWQSAAACIGVAVPSAVAGLLIENFGLRALMPYLCALAGLFFLLQLAALRILGQRG